MARDPTGQTGHAVDVVARVVDAPVDSAVLVTRFVGYVANVDVHTVVVVVAVLDQCLPC